MVFNVITTVSSQLSAGQFAVNSYSQSRIDGGYINLVFPKQLDIKVLHLTVASVTMHIILLNHCDHNNK